VDQEELFEKEPLDIVEGYTCIKCDIFQPPDQFRHMLAGEVKRTCKSCQRGHSKVISELRKLHPYPSDDHTCDCCGKGLEELGRYKQKRLQTWVLDHCHVTLTFRGWVCHKCNTGLGAFSDDWRQTDNATNYLRRHEYEVRGKITETMDETAEGFSKEQI